MTQHSQWRVRASFAIVLLAAFILAICIPVADVSQASSGRIRAGMMRHTVEEAVGGPPGGYDGTRGISSDAPKGKACDGIHTNESWVGRTGEIVVVFDRAGHVVSSSFYPAKTVDWSLVRLVRERVIRRPDSPAGWLNCGYVEDRSAG